jgi:hypothetical protein
VAPGPIDNDFQRNVEDGSPGARHRCRKIPRSGFLLGRHATAEWPDGSVLLRLQRLHHGKRAMADGGMLSDGQQEEGWNSGATADREGLPGRCPAGSLPPTATDDERYYGSFTETVSSRPSGSPSQNKWCDILMAKAPAW